jgi:hypothetical protein
MENPDCALSALERALHGAWHVPGRKKFPGFSEMTLKFLSMQPIGYINN